MNYKPIIILGGEPKSVFWEIFVKALKHKKYKSPIIFIGSLKLLKNFSIKSKYDLKFKILNTKSLTINDIDTKKINIINVELKQFNYNKSKSQNSNDYINNCFNKALSILNDNLTNKIINGPINKKKFLNKSYLGVTEYLAKKTDSKNFAMLIYNKKISVCPITTHLPLKYVAKKINKNNLISKIKLLNNFYKKYLKITPKIGVAGLNPHCESIDSFNEDEKILLPAIKILKKRGVNINGPFAADTLFMKKNRCKFDLIVGMYHDQILTPIKTLFEFDAINITVGLPFIRISPDHGPNETMIGKNSSNPLSLIRALEFLDR